MIIHITKQTALTANQQQQQKKNHTHNFWYETHFNAKIIGSFWRMEILINVLSKIMFLLSLFFFLY